MPDEPDDVALAALASLEREGVLVDEGSFTLDAAAAQRKINEHRVADPSDWLLFAAEAGVALSGHVDVSPRLGATVLDLHDVSLGRDELAELAESRFAEAGRPAGLALLALAIELVLGQPQARRVELLTRDASGEGWRAVYSREGEPAVQTQSSRRRDRATRMTVVHASRLGWTRRKTEQALLERHCRPSGGVGIGVDEPGYLGGIEGLLAQDFFSWTTRRGDASELRVGYEPGFEGSVALLYCNGVRLETVDLGGPRGVVLILDRPWSRDLSLRRARRDAVFDEWIAWARAWAEREVASIRPRART